MTEKVEVKLVKVGEIDEVLTDRVEGILAGDFELKKDADSHENTVLGNPVVTVSVPNCDEGEHEQTDVQREDEGTISNNDQEQIISVTPVPVVECDDKILNISESKLAEKAPSVDDLKTLDEKSMISEVNIAGSQPLRNLSSPIMSGFIEADELGGGMEDKIVVVGNGNKRGEEGLRNLVKDHEMRLSTASVSKLSSGDRPRVKRVSQQDLKYLQREVDKLKEIDPDYLKTLNRHNITVNVSTES